MVQWVEEPANKHENLSSSNRNITVEGENQLPQVVLRPPYVLWQCALTQTHTQAYKQQITQHNTELIILSI